MRYIEAKHLRGLEIDNQFISGGRLYGKIGRLRAFENAIDIDGGPRKILRRIRPVRGKAAANGIMSQPVNARQAILDCQRSNQLGVTGSYTHGRDQAAVRLIRECCNGAFDLASVASVDHAQIHSH